MEYPLDRFPENGFVSLGAILDPARCRALLKDVYATRAFSSALFLDEAAYRANPQHKGVNPAPGRNLIEKFDVSFIEQNPAFVRAIGAALGPGYRMLDKKFVVGVPESWMPDWLLRETEGLAVANLGAYIRPEYRDITYFHGIDFHQDIIDFKERRADFVTAYVYLEDTDANTSPLYVVPRSHGFGATRFPHGITYGEGRKIRYADGTGRDGAFEYLMLTGPVGSAYFWHSCVLHGTKPHMASTPRISVRMLIEAGPAPDGSLLARANAAIAGPLSLSETREDLDPAGRAVKRGNVINRESM